GSDDRLLAQYREVYETLRQNDRFMWQLPSLLTIIVGTLVAVVFTFMYQAEAPVWAGEGVLAIALVLTAVMSNAQRRYRYFSTVMTGTLCKLEEAMEVMHIQKTADAEITEIYPRGLRYKNPPLRCIKDGAPGPDSLFWLMVFTAVVIVILMVLMAVQTDSTKQLSCIDEVLSWAILGLSVVSTIMIIGGTRFCEKKRSKKHVQKSSVVEINEVKEE
ncbi:hypothetical protein ACFLVU_05625, partial [Chloroflexota bacterium]